MVRTTTPKTSTLTCEYLKIVGELFSHHFVAFNVLVCLICQWFCQWLDFQSVLAYFGFSQHSADLTLACPLPPTRASGIGLNLTNTFLVFTEEIGDLLNITLNWEGVADSWNSVWKSIKQSFWSNNTATPVLEVRRIRVKAGETQKM